MIQSAVSVCEDSLTLPPDMQISACKILRLEGRWLMLCRFGGNRRQKMFSFQNGQKQYICYLQRTIDEEYKNSLDQLVDIIDSPSRKEAEKCWIAIYKIYSFSCTRISAYNVGNPQYGQKVIIKGQGKMEKCVVSNCFKMDNSYYYFTDGEQTEIGSEMDVILDERCENILGLSLKIGELALCLPISELLQGKPTQFAIQKTIESTINKVVYISHEGSYCTGISFSPTYILTVKHLFNSIKPIGTIVDVRFYPYKKEMKAKVCGYVAEFLDLVVLSIDLEEKQEDICEILTTAKQQNIAKIQIGVNVHAIGFGRYPYSSHLFSKVELLLPTIANGIISKVIDHNQQQVYFKTDMQIYNGYSGCPIWHESSWLGNAFFIVKNPISSTKHPRHNFSYCRRFIQNFPQNHGFEGNKTNIETFLRQFQKIVTRKQLKIVARL